MAGEPGTGPLVTFARSGLAVRWPDTMRSLLELAEACDCAHPVGLPDGRVPHVRDTAAVRRHHYTPDPLEAPEPGQVLVCCSQPETDVVLDQ